MPAPTPQATTSEPRAAPESAPKPAPPQPVRTTPRSVLERKHRRGKRLGDLARALNDARVLAWASLVWLGFALAGIASDWLGHWQSLETLHWVPDARSFSMGATAVVVALAVQLVAWSRARTRPVAMATLHFGCIWIADLARTGSPTPEGPEVLMAVVALSIWRSLWAEHQEVAHEELSDLLESKPLRSDAEQIRATLVSTKGVAPVGWIDVACALVLAWTALPLLEIRASTTPERAVTVVAAELAFPRPIAGKIENVFTPDKAQEFVAELAARQWKPNTAQTNSDVDEWPARYVGDKVEVRLGEENPLVLALALEGGEWRVAGWRWDELEEERR